MVAVMRAYRLPLRRSAHSQYIVHTYYGSVSMRNVRILSRPWLWC